MAFRRVRRVVRRRRVPRRRRIVRRRRNFRSRPGKGNFNVKLTRFVSITQDIAKTTQFAYDITLADFPEYAPLANTFERIKLRRAKVTVLPQQNVSNNSTSIMPDYCMFPWKRELPQIGTFNTFLSIDRCKLSRGTACMSQTYVPSILVSVETQGSVGVGVMSRQVKYRPTLECTNDTGEVIIYTGGMGMQALTDAPMNAKAHYNVRIDVWCTFQNQNTLVAK